MNTKIQISRLFISALLLVAAVFSGPSLAGDGGYSGGGGDQIRGPNEVFVWFGRRDRTVNVCLDVSKKFGLSENILKSEVKNALDTWVDYIKTRKIGWSLRLAPDEKLNFPDAYKAYKSPVGFAKEYHISDICSGTEDLTFFFGSENEEVAKDKQKHLDPLAFAQLSSFNKRKLWGKGYIWVAANTSKIKWEKEGKLQAILLHEIGHTYGIDHIEGTIMTKGIKNLIADDKNAFLFNSIDHNRTLVLEDSNDYSKFTFTAPIVLRNVPHLSPLSKLYEFYNESFSVDTRISIEAVDRNSSNFRIYGPRINAKFESDFGAKEDIRGDFVFSHKGFKTQLRSSGRILYGNFVNFEGKTLPAILSVNLPDRSDYRLRLVIVHDGKFLQVGTFQLKSK